MGVPTHRYLRTVLFGNRSVADTKKFSLSVHLVNVFKFHPTIRSQIMRMFTELIAGRISMYDTQLIFPLQQPQQLIILIFYFDISDRIESQKNYSNQDNNRCSGESIEN